VQINKPKRMTAAAILFSDDKRLFRSAKEKRYEALYTIIKTIRNNKKIKDFNKMLTSYEELLKAFDKAKLVIAKVGGGRVTPRFYLRILVEMEDLINETWEDSVGRKNMFKVNGKSLGALRQKLRKYLHEKHDDNIAKFEDEGSDDDGDFRAKSEEKEIAPRKAKKIPPDGEDDESDD
jgi:translation initiation factor 3 subunit C